MEPLAVERDDTGGFLATVLQGMQAERRDGRGIRMAENAEYAALFAQPVGIGIEDIGIEVRAQSPSSALQCSPHYLLASTNCPIPISGSAIITCVRASVGGIAVFPMLTWWGTIRRVGIARFLGF